MTRNNVICMVLFVFCSICLSIEVACDYNPFMIALGVLAVALNFIGIFKR